MSDNKIQKKQNSRFKKIYNTIYAYLKVNGIYVKYDKDKYDWE